MGTLVHPDQTGFVRDRTSNTFYFRRLFNVMDHFKSRLSDLVVISLDMVALI